MTLRLAILLAFAGAAAVGVVRLRTEKRRCRAATTRLEVRKIELETDRWRLSRRVAEQTNAAELRRRAAEHRIEIEPEPAETRAEPRRAGKKSF
jgi:hypothetical protein